MTKSGALQLCNSLDEKTLMNRALTKTEIQVIIQQVDVAIGVEIGRQLKRWKEQSAKPNHWSNRRTDDKAYT